MFLDSRVYMNFRQVEVESGAVLKSIVRSKERSSADQNIWFIQVGGFVKKMPAYKISFFMVSFCNQYTW